MDDTKLTKENCSDLLGMKRIGGSVLGGGFEQLIHSDMTDSDGLQQLSDNIVNEEIEIAEHSLSNKDARKWYLAHEAKIPEIIDKSLSLEQQARQAFELRNQFRTQARELMEDRVLAEQLHKKEPNKTWEEIIQRQRDKGFTGDDIYREIIASSQRSRTSVNKSLGLE